jgi:mRNA interferase RelE/StbE
MKDIAEPPREYTRLVSQHIDEPANNRRPAGAKKLRGRDDYSLRVGVYPVLYDINDKTQVVTVYRVKHRREAYR